MDADGGTDWVVKVLVEYNHSAGVTALTRSPPERCVDTLRDGRVTKRGGGDSVGPLKEPK